MIEIRFQFPDPSRRFAAVRLAHQLRERLPHELTRHGTSWQLTTAAPDVARFEYQFELIDSRGRSEWVLDPDNAKTASGPWGDKSVWEEPGYEPPTWLEAEARGKAKAVTIPSRILKAELPALVWAHPEATESSPMLVAHDGPEYAEHSSLVSLLAGLPPLRAALLGPVDRNETILRRRRYARALVDEVLPALAPGRARSHAAGGASLGALASCTPTGAPGGVRRAVPAVGHVLPAALGPHETSFRPFPRISRFVGGCRREQAGMRRSR